MKNFFPFFLCVTLNIVTFAQSDTWSVKFSNAIISRYQPTINAMTNKGWEYSNGSILHGMEKVYLNTHDADYLNYIKAYVDSYVDASGNVTGLGMTVDKIQPGVLCLFLYEQTGQTKYKTAATQIKNYVNNFYKTPDGGIWHKSEQNVTSYKYYNVMMVDGMYMLHPFLTKYASMFNEPALFDAATFQLLFLASKVMPQPMTLPKHAWEYYDYKAWSDPSTHMSTDVWSRGTGWYMMALADVLEYLPTSHANYGAILELFQRMSSGVAANQHPTTGLWYQVVDKRTETGNWTESSGSGMFVYALKKGVEKGWLNAATYNPVINLGWQGLQTQIAILGDSGPQIKQFCVATGVVDNTAAYYALGKTDCPTAYPWSGTQHPHGYCGILMAASVMEFPLVNSLPSVSITSPSNGTSYTEPASVIITATASDTDGTISKVEFYQGTTKLGEDTSSPYTVTWSGVTQGTYNLTVVATDNSGGIATSTAVTITVNPAISSQTFSARISDGMNDAEEFSNGTVTRTSYALEMAFYSSIAGTQVVGLRFINVTIPKNATITQAYLQFTASTNNYAIPNLTIRGENSGNSAAFALTSGNISARTLTSSSVTWIPPSWAVIDESGSAQKTSDLSAIVQEIVNRPDWDSGNSMTFIISGIGARTAHSYETSSDKSAQILIDYY
ncbi:MAG TPA: glycoside hydrolase family 88 protein [Chitinophagaceae bacterium]|jgi:unsaturated rhamnogalacturonyl hydrolase|nr:glycoside hydrolase family 88 protein [Prolixibacteraceae bacterium]HNZ70041.1 glycoside hydrolase family 88 protein [Prolixibacteraceae bacterium]HOC87461.1 glycoside hydrolase family 88 protein [Prolixibacteraceae bacterium]HOG96932.1 glycoside hydrolase family 88 protein [Prolixibacteraceae bacterium]HPN58787.1 glycoside hydrolase family 88 protein [Chitinophagaceae bacterium]